MLVQTPESELDYAKDPFRKMASMSLFMRMREQFTPDLHELNQYMRHIVFFPKKIKSHFGGYKDYIERPGSDYLGGAISVVAGYQKRCTPIGEIDSYVINVDENGSHIEGYAVSVPVSYVCDLDLRNNHGQQTIRLRRHFWLEAQNPIISVPAWIWVNKQEYLDKVNATCDPDRHIRYCGKVTNIKGKDVLV